MDRYIGDIIDSQRNDTRNAEDEEAISDSEFVRFNQHAQDRLYTLISLAHHSYAFEVFKDINIVAGQSDYSIPDNYAFGMRITRAYYSHDGQVENLRRLKPTPNRPEVIRRASRPIYYRRRQEKVVLEPTPDTSQGIIRVYYERALDRLALRAAQVNGTPSGTTITVDNADANVTGGLVSPNHICISDPYGTPLLYNGVVSSYAGSTLTLTGNVSDYLVDGVTLADLDNGWVTIGKYSTTHSSLPNEAEGFFIEWVNRKLHAIDSSEQFDEADEMLAEIRDSIVASYELPDKDVKSFPISNYDLLIPEYD